MKASPLVLVTTSFPIGSDGSEAAGSFVADLVTELAKGTRVKVVAPGKRTARELWSEHVEVYRFAAPSRPLSTLKPWRPKDVGWIVRVMHGGLDATRCAATEGAAHILALWGLPCGEWARRAAKKCGIDYSVWLLGSDVWSLGRVPVLRGMLARVIRQARNAYADGYMLADDARQIGSRPVEFLPSTRRIDVTDPLPPRAQPPYRLLFLGRWHPNKGIDLLLDALESLSEADWRNIENFEIQGGGPLDSTVHERVAALRRASRPVTAGGFLAKADAEAAIERSDWLVIPSRIESIPVVFSDAMKLRRPVIATPVGDMGRLLSESKAGLVAQGATAYDVAATLRLALASNASEFAVQTEKLAAEFNLARIAEHLRVRCVGAVGDRT